MIRTAEMRGAFFFVTPATLLTLTILAVPLFYIFYNSVGGAGLSLAAFRDLLSSGLFLRTLATTVIIAVSSAVLSLVLGYIIALHLTRQPPKRRSIYMMLVLLPFWTSVLVKCYAFTVLLGRAGLVNEFLSWVAGSPVQLELVLNRIGVLIGMTNYLTPFVVFPILASLLAIDPAVYRAATVMGAGPVRIFFTVTLPLSLPGIIAALSSVMVMGLGFFVIPALLGGPRDAMLSNLVDFYTRETLDWNMASAAGVLLLGLVVLVTVPLTILRKRKA
ncbi:ABC transporter permease [Pseudorhizobium endolithicum]|uniref:ABC transporter permease n=1 Tax=Pseudorhizobium endolithicum TaxID=1191678 RepID=A0ABN7JN01_9HYPH|nr:ABC transporter permease [Pseudorhizobium endolithicum]CAD7037674.1 ABC transporter permease [Pseudorhizobium endolithicum]